MKNFRKTIIALATVAAMLVPSVAMAATITAEVDSSVAGNVYAGIYNGGVLQKAVLGGTTTAEAGAGSTEATPLDKPAVTGKIVTVDEETGAKKLVFNLMPTEDLKIAAMTLTFSFDAETIQPIASDGTEMDVFDDPEGTVVAYSDPFSGEGLEINNNTWYSSDNRAYGWLNCYTSTPINVPADGMNVYEFYFTVMEGKEITDETFSMVTDGNVIPMDPSQNAAAAIYMGDGSVSYQYGSYSGKASTMEFGGFEEEEAVVATPVTKPVVTMENGVASENAEIYKLMFKVQVPEGYEEIDATELTFTYDTSVVMPVRYDTGKDATNSTGKKKVFKAYSFPGDPENNFGRGFDAANPTWNGGEVTIATEAGDYTLDLTNGEIITTFHYRVLDGKEVTEDTFTLNSLTAGDVEWTEESTEVDYTTKGFPWSPVEGGNKTLTIENVDLTGVTYDEVRVFVWDDKQIAQCDSLAMTDGEVVVK